MDRNNPFYKLRRQAQVLAFHILPHETLSKLYFQILLHYTPNLKKPETLNEKLKNTAHILRKKHAHDL